MLKIDDVHTYYGDSYILQGVSLEVPSRKVAGLLGRNGAGKTTLIRSIIGFNAPRRGRIFFKGIEITGLSTHKIARLKIGLVPQGRRIFPSLSVEENLKVAARPGSESGWSRERIFDFFPSLEKRTHHKGNELSGGEQQMLAIARALIANPEFILMDEPTEGLAPLLVEDISAIILKLKEAGLAMLVVEQNLMFALKVSDETHILSKGKIVYSSPPCELWDNQEIKSQFLGV